MKLSAEEIIMNLRTKLSNLEYENTLLTVDRDKWKKKYEEEKGEEDANR